MPMKNTSARIGAKMAISRGGDKSGERAILLVGHGTKITR
jgi:hypothetical protein